MIHTDYRTITVVSAMANVDFDTGSQSKFKSFATQRRSVNIMGLRNVANNSPRDGFFEFIKNNLILSNLASRCIPCGAVREYILLYSSPRRLLPAAIRLFASISYLPSVKFIKYIVNLCDHNRFIETTTTKLKGNKNK